VPPKLTANQDQDSMGLQNAEVVRVRQAYPRPNRANKGVTCLGMIRAEKFEDPAKTVSMYDACNTNP
jgi:hypothetical protein